MAKQVKEELMPYKDYNKSMAEYTYRYCKCPECKAAKAAYIKTYRRKETYRRKARSARV